MQYPELETILTEVRDYAEDLLSKADGRSVLDAVVREGKPLFMAYMAVGAVPHPEQLQRIATYMIALAAAMDKHMAAQNTRRRRTHEQART